MEEEVREYRAEVMVVKIVVEEEIEGKTFDYPIRDYRLTLLRDDKTLYWSVRDEVGVYSPMKYERWPDAILSYLGKELS